MFANPKNISTFALSHLHNSVNHRIYKILHKRLGVVYLYSNDTVISGCDNSESITLSFLSKFKFFTNVTPSKKFRAREQQYLATNALPSDRAQTTISTQPTEKKELGKATLFPAIGLFFRELYGDVRSVSAQVVQDFFQSIQHCYSVCTDQRQSVFWQWQNIQRSISESNVDYSPVSYHLNSFLFHNY